MPHADVIHGHDEAFMLWESRVERVSQVRGEGGDAALTRHMIAQYGDSPDAPVAAGGFHGASTDLSASDFPTGNRGWLVSAHTLAAWA
jgi:hypothetical protein